MKTRGTGRKKRREGLGNRLAIIGITIVVLSLAVVVNVKFLRNMSQRAADILRDDLANRGPVRLSQVENEQKRAAELEERRVYVQTKQYIEEVAKQKLGLVKPDEILLKPRPKDN